MLQWLRVPKSGALVHMDPFSQESGHHALKNQPCQYKGAENVSDLGVPCSCLLALNTTRVLLQASKSASSDALKRCLKNFGRRLG